MDREKVIKGLNYCTHIDGVECPNCPYWQNDDCVEALHADALALLKEQEEREKRICKTICDFIRGSCSTDTYADKEFVCHEIQKCFMKGR